MRELACRALEPEGEPDLEHVIPGTVAILVALVDQGPITALLMLVVAFLGGSVRVPHAQSARVADRGKRSCVARMERKRNPEPRISRCSMRATNMPVDILPGI